MNTFLIYLETIKITGQCKNMFARIPSSQINISSSIDFMSVTTSFFFITFIRVSCTLVFSLMSWTVHEYIHKLSRVEKRNWELFG